MPKIKLIKVYNTDCHSCDCSNYAYDEMSSWQEVSEEELEFLSSMKGRQLLGSHNVSLVVLQDVTDQKQHYINDIKEFIRSEKIKEQKRIEKEKETLAKRKETVEKRKIEKAKKLLEKNGIKVP